MLTRHNCARFPGNTVPRTTLARNPHTTASRHQATVYNATTMALVHGDHAATHVVRHVGHLAGSSQFSFKRGKQARSTRDEPGVNLHRTTLSPWLSGTSSSSTSAV